MTVISVIEANYRHDYTCEFCRKAHVVRQRNQEPEPPVRVDLDTDGIGLPRRAYFCQDCVLLLGTAFSHVLAHKNSAHEHAKKTKEAGQRIYYSKEYRNPQSGS